ncbi:hypothetical protein Tco_0738001 [Tanacetum coccineum]
MTPAQHKEYMSNYIKNQEGGYSIKQLKSLSFEQVKEIFETTMRKVQYFVPIGSELEVQRLKRAGQEVLEEPVKRQKIGEALGSGEESAEKEKELSEENKEIFSEEFYGRMIEDIDQDAGISLVTPTKVSSQEDQSEDQLGVLCAAKVLADAAKKNVNTYTRRRRAVSTGISTAGMFNKLTSIIPSSSEIQKIRGQAIMKENKEPKFNAEQEELLASETTKDEANPPVTNID